MQYVRNGCIQGLYLPLFSAKGITILQKPRKSITGLKKGLFGQIRKIRKVETGYIEGRTRFWGANAGNQKSQIL